MLKTVSSFDIFDTLIGRIHGSPETVFDSVARISEFPNYKHIRKLAESKSNGTWDSIWIEFQSLTMMPESQIDDIKDLEWQMEKAYSFPITTNIVLLKSKDILVSDMYLPEFMIKELLKLNSITSYDKIYVSPNGKRSGNIWPKIKDDGYKIMLHTGDNFECDILSPKKHNIPTSYFDPKYSSKEVFLFNSGKQDIANLLRIVRLSNIYTMVDENRAILWNILSDVLPICEIVFTSKFKDKYELHFPDIQYSYKCNFDAYINNNDVNIIHEMIAITHYYSSRLKIDYDAYDLDDDMLFYMDKYCEIMPNDIL